MAKTTMARGAEPFGFNIYSPEEWRRRRRLDVIRIVDAHGRGRRSYLTALRRNGSSFE